MKGERSKRASLLEDSSIFALKLRVVATSTTKLTIFHPIILARSATALEMANIDPSQVDMVIMCTSSPDDLFGDASTVANAIGASKAVAFDLTAACSGFLFGCVTAGQFLTNNKMTAVVVGADALTRWVDWDDRNSCILFGDGAGAVVLQSDELNSKVSETSILAMKCAKWLQT